MDRINQIWPSWHTVELIGRGSFGEVYKVKREQLGELFYSAVKVIRIPQEETEIKEMLDEGHTSQSIRYYYEPIVTNLMNEIKVMDVLKSVGNVVNIEEFDVREREDSVGWDAYIRMELLENLNKYRKVHRMGEGEVARLGIDLCGALIYCERSHIIHRDIKPSNIFVDKYGTFKLGDFGIARQMEKTKGTLSKKGTELYMAPEIRDGKSKSSYNVDIYSLGLVMYRMLNRNRMPFEPVEKEMMNYREREEALERRLRGEILPLPVDCDAQLGEIIRKACEYDKEKRYQSASEMKEKLEAWIRKKSSTAMDSVKEKEEKSRYQTNSDIKIDPVSNCLNEETTVAAFTDNANTHVQKEIVSDKKVKSCLHEENIDQVEIDIRLNEPKQKSWSESKMESKIGSTPQQDLKRQKKKDTVIIFSLIVLYAVIYFFKVGFGVDNSRNFDDKMGMINVNDNSVSDDKTSITTTNDNSVSMETLDKNTPKNLIELYDALNQFDGTVGTVNYYTSSLEELENFFEIKGLISEGIETEDNYQYLALNFPDLENPYPVVCCQFFKDGSRVISINGSIKGGFLKDGTERLGTERIQTLNSLLPDCEGIWDSIFIGQTPDALYHTFGISDTVEMAQKNKNDDIIYEEDMNGTRYSLSLIGQNSPFIDSNHKGNDTDREFDFSISEGDLFGGKALIGVKIWNRPYNL